MPRTRKVAQPAPVIQAEPNALRTRAELKLSRNVVHSERSYFDATITHGSEQAFSLRINHRRDLGSGRGQFESKVCSIDCCRDDHAAVVKELLLWALAELPALRAASARLESAGWTEREDPAAAAALYNEVAK